MPAKLMPIFPLKAVLLPAGALELRIFEPRYQAMMNECLRTESPFAVVFCTTHDDEVGSLRAIGCLAHIVEHMTYEDGTARLLVEGAERLRIGNIDARKPYLRAEVDVLEDADDVDEGEPLLATAKNMLEVYRDTLEEVDSSMLKPPLTKSLRASDSFKLIDQILLPEDKRQTALELGSPRSRFELAVKYLRVETARLEFLLAEPDEAASAVN